MAISSALSTALSGLRTTQQQLAVTSGNIANADSAGYSRRTVSASELSSAGRTYGVDSTTVTREINLLVQKQWRTANANSAYAEVRLDSLDLLDSYFGGPDDSSSLTSVYGAFTDAMQALATTPDSLSNQTTTVAAAKALAATLNSLSENVQSLRQQAESGIADGVDKVNGLLETIADLDRQVVAVSAGGGSTAALEDQRDAAVDELSQYVDIRVDSQPTGAITVSTTSGTVLYDNVAVKLGFDEHGVVTSDSVYSADDAERSLGTVTIVSGPGKGTDLFKSGTFRSGSIAAYKDLRDETLVEAQNQLDSLAATLSLACGTRYDAGTQIDDADGAGNSGYQVDIGNLAAGNTVSLSYTDGSGAHTLTFVAQEDGAPAIGDGATADPADKVYGIDLGGTDDVATQINAVLATLGLTGMAANLTGGSDTLRIADDGSGTARLAGATATVSAGGLQSGGTALPFFVDAATGEAFCGPYGDASSTRGLAGRLAVNPAVAADPSLLVDYAGDTPSGDGARPQAILDALAGRNYTYSSATGIGSKAAPFSGAFDDFLAQVMSAQGAQAELAQQLSDGQGVVTSNLEDRYNASREVDMDSELASLISLQTAYAANARVMNVAKEMMDTLLNAFN